MAALTTQAAAIAAGFVFNEIWYEGGDGQRRIKCLDVNIPSGYGGAVNTIAAACFGLTTVEIANNFRTVANSGVGGAFPSYDRTKLSFSLVETAGTPTDLVAIVRGTVKGKE